ncbi:IS3 family transposase [Thomasclavelia saccharogumia]|uniref:IS3 family transposase n=1 Tax=Thomasclavelia saccharogumia TaxID=341225 RepID=UPI0004790C0D|nr:IS3 family transposase [Thomasclavelia saccharogumia]
METAEEKYKIIEEMISRDNNLLNITKLCEIAEVSRSGFYNWKNSHNKRQQKEQQDKEDFNLILQAYQYRGYDKGARSIHMTLLHMGIRMNIKKIRRLMKKYGLFCRIRKANPYRRMAKAIKTNNIVPNIVNRDFIQEPRMIILTDITYLFYGKERRKAYLSVMKDAFTNEILSYVVSDSLEVDFVLITVKQLFEKHGATIKTKETICHSDQGSHYTSIEFQKILKDKGLRQSMSRRGNCWDNAPQESFFGHMKDEIDISSCRTFDELTAVIDDYMDYYNNERYQWDLAKLSPSEYYQYWLTDIYPIDIKNDTIQK